MSEPEPHRVNMIELWRLQQYANSLEPDRMQKQYDRMERLLEQLVTALPPRQFADVTASLNDLSNRLEAEPLIKALNQATGEAASMVEAMNGMTRQFQDILDHLKERSSEYQKQRFWLVWAPLIALVLTLIITPLTAVFAYRAYSETEASIRQTETKNRYLETLDQTILQRLPLPSQPSPPQPTGKQTPSNGQRH